jgi:hypothetical protein
VPRISTSGDTATFTLESLRRAILALKYDVPRPPIAPASSTLPTTCGMLALNCSRGVSPNAASKIGASTSLAPPPDQRITEKVSSADPGSSSVASSTHESGDAPVAVDSGDAPTAAVVPGSELLLGGVLFLFFPGALALFPCAAADTATASAAMTLAVTSESRPPARITGLRK